jgi:hypothetical protein
MLSWVTTFSAIHPMGNFSLFHLDLLPEVVGDNAQLRNFPDDMFSVRSQPGNSLPCFWVTDPCEAIPNISASV